MVCHRASSYAVTPLSMLERLFISGSGEDSSTGGPCGDGAPYGDRAAYGSYSLIGFDEYICVRLDSSYGGCNDELAGGSFRLLDMIFEFRPRMKIIAPISPAATTPATAMPAMAPDDSF